MPEPAAPLLVEALDFLAAHGIEITVDRVAEQWRYVMDGKATTEGEVVARAVGLGMLGHGTRQ